MVTMGEALFEFDAMLNDTETWANGATCCEQREVNGSQERRVYDLTAATQAIKVAQAAISGDGDEQTAIKMLLDVVHAAQWHAVG